MCNMESMVVVASVCLLLLPVSLAANGNDASDACYTYAGGQVYPGERMRGGEHSLQWSKAQSQCFQPTGAQDGVT